MPSTEPLVVAEPRRALTAFGLAVLLAISVASSVFFVYVYWFDWGTQWYGLSMAMALLSLGAALVLIAHRVLPHGTYVEHRDLMPSPAGEQLAFALDFGRDSEIHRRRFLWMGVGGALGAFVLAGLAPIRSLGSRPGAELYHTAWRAGLRAVDEHGRPIRAADIPVGGAVAVFPEGHTSTAQGQAIAFRASPGDTRNAKVKPGPDGIYIYSSVCTHMGCPVTQVLAQSNQLMCPCHQSIFDILEGAKPTFGPAGRALPSLPFRTNANGVIVATGDFDAPVGPSFWTLG